MNVEVPRCALILQGNGRLYCGIPEHICRESWGLCLGFFVVGACVFLACVFRKQVMQCTKRAGPRI